MIYHQFEKDKKDLAQQYKNINWNTESGKSVDQLRAECETICQDMDGESRILIKAELFKHIMQYAQLEVNEKDWFANKINHGQIITDIRTRWITQLNHGAMADILQENEGFQECRAFIGDVDFGHVAPDWYVILEEGIPGILSKIQSMKTNRNLSKDQEEFYQACETVYEALICYMNRLAQEAECCARENEKMAIVAENLRNLTRKKPQTLLEGMQLTVIFYYIQTWVEGTAIRSLGGLDRLYFSLYQNDLKTGKYSENQIREFMDYFLYEFYAMGATANTPFYLCGVERDGNLVYNELSSLILEEYVKLNVHDPKIHIRYGKDLPETFLKKVLEHIRNGNNSIVFMNDDIVIKSLMASGEMLQDARDYVTIGCYEPAALGKEVPCTSAGRVNIAKALELVMNHGVDMMTGKKLAEVSENSDTFDAFYESVKDMIALLIRRTMDIINGYESQYRNLNPSPMFSATLEDCLMKGKDAYEGGLKYNNTSVSPFGMATVVDGILAVKKAVYEEKSISLQEFGEALRKNWEGHRLLWLKCKNMYPKYGNNDPEADALMLDLTEFICAEINGKANKRGGIYRCGLWSIDWCSIYGEVTGATPDGRHHGERISKNMCASTGCDRKGITTLIQSVTKIDYTRIPNGSVLDVVLHSSAVRGADGLEAMFGLLKTYMDKGGMAIQFNVLNPSILREAQKNPEMFATLQVRLCGWNVYFVNLSEKEQNEFIRLAEHASV